MDFTFKKITAHYSHSWKHVSENVMVTTNSKYCIQHYLGQLFPGARQYCGMGLAPLAFRLPRTCLFLVRC